MRSLFGVPTASLLLAVGGLVLLMLLVLGWVGWRNPLVLRLALRNLPRRPGWAALITLSLTLSTVILSSAFTTGDTMQTSVRAVVAGALGTADVVVFMPRPWRGRGADLVQALASGTFLTGVTDYFPEQEVDRIRDLLRDDERVAGVLPVALEQAAVAAPGRSFRARLNVLGVPAAPAGFDRLRGLDGAPLPLAALGTDEVYINNEAAVALGVGAGETLRLFGLGDEPVVRVRAVAGVGELGGAQATLFMPLARLQALVERPGEVNQILIANQGTPAERLSHSWPLTVRLRAALLDDPTADRLYRTMSAPAMRQAIAAATARERGWLAEKLARLEQSLAAGRPTPAFEALVQDPEVLGSLAQGWGDGGRLDAWRGGRALERGLRATVGDGAFRVLDVQQVAQDQAERWGSAFTDVFVVLGLFSLSTGLLLVVLVVSLLALERRSELGVLRALGGRRSDVILVLATEGALYSLLASTVGLVAGAALAYGLVWLAGAQVAQYGFRLEPAVEPASLALSFGLGLLLTFATVTTTAWRASRFSIVTAIRDQPDPAAGQMSARALLPAALSLAAGLGLAGVGLDRRWALAYTVGVVLAIVGLALVARWAVRRAGARALERVVVSLAGLLLIGWWQVPPAWARALALPVFPARPELSVLSGLAMLLGAVWLIAYNVGLLRRLRGGAALWRLSTAYVAAHRFRTGMTIAMFGLVVLSLTLGAVLLTATHVAFADPAAATGGWAIRADADAPPRDLRPELRAGAVAPELFGGIGATATLPVEAIQIDAGDARWRPARLMLVDAGFTEAVSAQLTGASGPPRATWQELTRRPGTAVVGAALLNEATGLRVMATEGAGFRPFVLWVRDTRSLQPAVRLEVIGLVDGRGPFGRSLLTGAATVAAWPAPETATYYFAVPDGASPAELAAGLSLSLAELRVQLIAQELRLVQGVRGLLGLILSGFMGTGLLAGVAALGAISLRATVERRRQIGVLRALGFSARAVGLGLLLEAGIIALLGTLLGVGLGLVVARGTIAALTQQSPELRFGVPWEQLGLIVLAALAASLLMTLLPARQAARLAPAEALREV